MVLYVCSLALLIDARHLSIKLDLSALYRVAGICLYLISEIGIKDNWNDNRWRSYDWAHSNHTHKSYS